MTFFKWLWKGLKKTWKAASLFFHGVLREIKRVRWPSYERMFESTTTVVTFSVFFALFFSACYTIGHAVLAALGYFG